MRIPKKIEPDRIKDSIVQVYFTSELPFELLIGYFHSVLVKKKFQYYSQPNPSKPITPVKQPQLNQEVKIHLSHLFVNDEKTVKLQIHQNKSLSFNNISKYIGWSKYSACIHGVIEALITAGFINSIKRIGIRYISEFQNIDILDKVKFSYDSSFPGFPVNSSHSNLRWSDIDTNISLNIASRVPSQGLVDENEQQVDFLSFIDVDVIKQNFESSNLDEIISFISRCHMKQKEVFFSLLKEEFLNELNPLY